MSYRNFRNERELQEFSLWSFTWSKNLIWHLTGIALQNGNGYGLDFDWNSYEIIYGFEMNSLDPEILKWFFEIWGGEWTVERISKTLERIWMDFASNGEILDGWMAIRDEPFLQIFEFLDLLVWERKFVNAFIRSSSILNSKYLAL